MNEENNEGEKYIIYEGTIAEVRDYIKEHKTDRETHYVYEHNCPNRATTEAEMYAQRENSWRAKETYGLFIRDDKIVDLITDTITKLLKNKYRGVLADKALEEIYGTKVYIYAQTSSKKSPDGYTYNNLHTEDIIGMENLGEEFSRDIEEFEKELDKFDVSTYIGGGKHALIHLESLKVNIQSYYYRDSLEERIEKALKRYMREKLTYCLKSGKCIVPDEYLDKGAKGVEEWRDLKSSKNKNNSIEKRLIRDTLRDKKNYAYSCVTKCENAICKANDRWDIPNLGITGRFNVGMNTKLVADVLKSKTKQEIIEMSKEETLKQFKEIWKKKLMDAYKNVDKLSEEDIVC